MNIGLSGGIACGKSLAMEVFETNGFHTVSLDRIVADLYRNDVDIKQSLQNKFGEDAIDDVGVVDHKYLASRVFNDAEDLLWLEDLVHPKVREIWQKLISDEKKRHSIVEIPLLFEKKLEKYFDSTLCIESSVSSQKKRLIQRGLLPDEAMRRINLQMPIAKKIDMADYVIANNGSIAFFYKQISYFIAQIP